MRKCTNPDPQGPARMAILATPFTSQASLDIRQKLPKLDQEPQTSFPTLWIRTSRSSITQREPQGLIGNRETSSKPSIWLQLSQAPCPSLGPPRGRSHYRYKLLSPPPFRKSSSSLLPLSPEGHLAWKHQMPPPPGPCRAHKQSGYWRRDCPSFPHAGGSSQAQKPQTQAIPGNPQP